MQYMLAESIRLFAARFRLCVNEKPQCLVLSRCWALAVQKTRSARTYHALFFTALGNNQIAGI